MTTFHIEAVCRGCGCSDSHACEGGCVWATSDLCSRCALGLNPSHQPDEGRLFVPELESEIAKCLELELEPFCD